MAAKSPLRVEIWAIDRLRPYEGNARVHSDEQVRQIAKSITEFGFLNPILVAADDGILAGHGRLLAARDLGLTEVPVIPCDHLTAEQRRAYVIADNQLALNADWNVSILQSEIVALSLQDYDLGVLGFSDDDVARFLDPENLENDFDRPPSPGGAAADDGDDDYDDEDDDAESPGEFPEVDTEGGTDHRCPSCGYEWNGKGS